MGVGLEVQQGQIGQNDLVEEVAGFEQVRGIDFSFLDNLYFGHFYDKCNIQLLQVIFS